MKEFEYRLQIKEYHLDTFGHVNNAVYLNLYEEARWDFISKNGYGLEIIQKNQKGPVVLEANVRFKRELKNREFITIKSVSEPSKGKIMKIKQMMVKEDGQVASEALFVVGFMDMKLRKLIEPTEEWLKAIGFE